MIWQLLLQELMIDLRLTMSGGICGTGEKKQKGADTG